MLEGPYSFDDFRGHPVVLAFLPGNGVGDQVHLLLLDSGVIARVADCIARDLGTDAHPAFLLASREGDLARRYGATGSSRITVIDEDGLMRWSRPIVDGDHLTIGGFDQRSAIGRRNFIATMLMTTLTTIRAGAA
jgi:hypothetical protein